MGNLLIRTRIKAGKDCSINSDKQECCSARNCSGKVLSNKDAHNCKLSGGKSWHKASSDQCDVTSL